MARWKAHWKAYVIERSQDRPRKRRKRRPAYLVPMLPTEPDPAWIRGFATALAEMYRLLLSGHEPRGICQIAAAAGVSLSTLRKAKVHSIDVRALRKAGLP
jgi:hypothetical protein